MKFSLTFLFSCLCYLLSQAQITLTFVEAQTGKPIEGLEVELKYGRKSLAKGSTDTNGKFHCEKTVDNFNVEIQNKADLYESGPFHVGLYPKYNPENLVRVRWNRTIESKLIEEMEARDSEMIKKIREQFNDSNFEPNEKDEHIDDAAFPGGAGGMQAYIRELVRYPMTSLEMNEQGKVYTGFVVDADGRVNSVCILRGVSPDLDREAKLLLLYMPVWLPGKEEGIAKRTLCRLPVNFTLN